MQFDIAQCVNKGMQRDYSMDKSSQEFAYENRNIRITTTGNNSFLSVTNEKSTKQVKLIKDPYYIYYDTEKQYRHLSSGDVELTKYTVTFDSPLPYDHVIFVYITVGFHTTQQRVLIEKGATSYEYPINTIDTSGALLRNISIESWVKTDFQLVWRDHELEPDYLKIDDDIIGATVLGEHIVLFTVSIHNNEINNIYRCKFKTIEDTEYLLCESIFTGNLEFEKNKPIECITSYEADDVQKVYWVDGKNQPRVINICKKYPESAIFDFVPKIPKNAEVSIEKEYNGGGSFPSGIIQYFITFYNKFEAETGVAYESPLYYISPQERGGDVNEINTCSFKINIELKSKEYEYARIYSLIRTSLNSTPQSYIVSDVALNTSDSKIQIIDTNISHVPIPATSILYTGGTTIIASTIESKDNTLFLGNIEEITTSIIDKVKEVENKGTLRFGSKFIKIPDILNQYYPYSPNLSLSSQDIKTFKYLEWYKIGIQFQLNTGEWTSVVFLEDIQNTIYPNTQSTNNPYDDTVEFDNGMWLPAISFSPSTELIEVLNEESIIKNWRLVMAEHSPETRTIKAQGLVIPTIYNLKERANNTCYSAPLWTLGTVEYSNHSDNVDLDHGGNYSGAYAVQMYPFFHLPLSAYYKEGNRSYKLSSTIVNKNSTQYNSGEYLINIKPIVTIDRDYGSAVDRFYVYLRLGIKKETVDENKISYHDILVYEASSAYGQRKNRCHDMSNVMNSKIWADIWDYTVGDIKVSDLDNISSTETIFKVDEFPSGDALRDNYGISAINDITIDSIPTYIRDIVYSKEVEYLNNYGKQYFVDANICDFISPDLDNVNSGLKLRLVGHTKIVNSISDYTLEVEGNTINTTTYKAPDYNFNTYKLPVFGKDSYFTGIKSFPLWPFSNKLYYIHYWNNGGNILNDKFNLKSKKFANMWVCGETTYDRALEYGNIYNLSHTDNNTILLNSKMYKSEYQNVLAPANQDISYIGGGSDTDVQSKKPINESAPLEVVTEAVKDSTAEYIFETLNKVGTINIKYKTSRHLTFQLPELQAGTISILPNYDPGRDGNGFIYSDIGYPQTAYKLDGIISVCENFIQGTFESSTEETGKITLNPNDSVTFDLGDTITTFKSVYYKDFADNINLAILIGNTSSSIVDKSVYDIFNRNNKFLNKCYILEIFDTKGHRNLILIKVKGERKLIINSSGDYRIELTVTYGPISDSDIILYQQNGKSYTFDNTKHVANFFCVSKTTIFRSPSISGSSYKDKNAKLYIGEFYTDYDPTTFFGGSNENCKFIPIGPAYSKDTVKGWGFEGDTYYQRYDNVRLYEASSTDVNQNIDAVSFMLETYKNLDGDYRTQRGRLNTTTLTVDNTNDILNDVYSQSNNYKSSYILDEKFEDSTHPTLYAWSLSKQALSDIDTWTSINLASSAKLDGDKGNLTKIKKWNNQLLAFQEKGMAVINFNQQTTISTSEGVPVEIANSGKVTGHYYISSTQGCKNKWSIIDSPYGLYFIDSYNKSINVFGSGGIKSLSTINLFQDWIVENEKGIIWNPLKGNEGFRTFYDPINKEVYFVNNKTALCYNELLSQFTSFYDYPNLSSLLTFDGHIIGTETSNVYKMFEGDDYCNLFGKPVGFSMTYKINKDPFIDKTWTNIEYRADVFDTGSIVDKNASINPKDTFDTLEVWNEYQRGIANLKGDKYPNAKCKFRIWRADIPRDSFTKRDRIRNPWVMLKLEKTSNTNKRMEFHDLLIKYLQ